MGSFTCASFSAKEKATKTLWTTTYSIITVEQEQIQPRWIRNEQKEEESSGKEKVRDEILVFVNTLHTFNRS